MAYSYCRNAGKDGCFSVALSEAGITRGISTEITEGISMSHVPLEVRQDGGDNISFWPQRNASMKIQSELMGHWVPVLRDDFFSTKNDIICKNK